MNGSKYIIRRRSDLQYNLLIETSRLIIAIKGGLKLLYSSTDGCMLIICVILLSYNVKKPFCRHYEIKKTEMIKEPISLVEGLVLRLFPGAF